MLSPYRIPNHTAAIKACNSHVYIHHVCIYICEKTDFVLTIVTRELLVAVLEVAIRENFENDGR